MKLISDPRDSCKFVVLALIAIGVFSCANQTREVPEQDYYVEIKLVQEDSFNSNLAAFLKTNIAKQKYTFTYQSAKAWPYYAPVDLDETVAQDSIMPPHWYIHRMIIKPESLILKEGDRLVRIELMPKPDTVPNYRIDMYEIDSTGLTFAATSGMHFVDTTKFTNRKALFDYYLKSIIRYSFK